MGKMSYIHHLCETNNKKELIEELGSTQMAEGFLEAHKEMRNKKHNKAFAKLNEIVDNSIKEHKKESIGDRIGNTIKKNIDKINSASVGIRDNK